MKSSEKIRLIASDLDGTLLYRDGFREKDLTALHELGEEGAVRVIATGRNLHFAREALADDFPIDYLIFSSGAGIVRWSDGALLHAHRIEATRVPPLVMLLNRLQLNFMLHREIPAEHHFLFRRNNPQDGDFTTRLARHQLFARELGDTPLDFPITQALLFIPADQRLFAEIVASLPDFKMIRTSSPFGSAEIWVEIFPPHVSKGAALTGLCADLAIPMEKTVSLGNDYNDLDLLEVTGLSYVVEQAPEELRQRYRKAAGEAALRAVLLSLK